MGIKALENALTVFRCFSAAQPEWRIVSLSRATGLSKSHVFKIIQEFVAAGFLTKDVESVVYRVGPQAMAVGAGFLTSHPLARIGGDFIRDLARETGLTVTLNITDGEAIFFVALSEGSRGGYPSWPVGAALPRYATAAGKVHAAFIGDGGARCHLAEELSAVKERGFACARGESTPGLGAIGVPVFRDYSQLAGAISLLFPLERDEMGRRKSVLRLLRQTAANISHRIGAEYYPFHAS
jgi:IclR family KDG regulon transcriptional repressor